MNALGPKLIGTTAKRRMEKNARERMVYNDVMTAYECAEYRCDAVEKVAKRYGITRGTVYAIVKRVKARMAAEQLNEP